MNVCACSSSPGPVLACITRAVLKLHPVSLARRIGRIPNAKVWIARCNGSSSPTKPEPLLALVFAVRDLDIRPLGDGFWMPTENGHKV